MSRKLTHDMTLEVLGWKVRIKGTTTIEDIEPKPKSDNKPTSEGALWVAALFKRSPDTAWSDREIGAYVKHKALLTPDNREVLQSYYESQRKLSDGVHRRDLQTMLSNLPSELDRAHAAKLQPQHFNGTHRQPASESPRSLGTKNEGVAASYAGVGKVRTQP